jgi:radical SAM superfamily enzyme YgiQ (UPF0313 family)
MNKILLINPSHDEEHYKYKRKTFRVIYRDPPPISILYIGTYLSEFGFDIEIIDTKIEENFEELITKKIKENDYLFVGLNVIIGKILKNAKNVTNLIKEIKPNLPIVWGGIMASISPEDCLKEYRPDYIVRFEGEEAVLELANAIKNKKSINKIQGISYKKNGKVIHNPARIPKKNLDDYPIPKWELFGEKFNKKQVPYYFLLMSSKGCPFNCTFCYKHSIDEKVRSKLPSWRARSADHLIKEMDYINKKTGTKVFTFGDDNFLVNKKRTKEIFDYLRKNEFYIEECIGHLNCVDDEIIDIMGGIVQTFIFSIETASPRLQKYINKEIDLESIPGKVEKMYKKGIACTTSFIVGLPTEKKEDLRKNIDMMLKLKEINPFMRGNIYLYFPLPKTKLFDTVEEIYNVKIPSDINKLEEANFWVKDVEDPVGRKFRPWIDDDRFRFLVKYGLVFNDIFKVNNRIIDDEVKELLKNDSEIKEMFKGVENVNCPKTDYKPYVLDKVLNGEKINLINGLKGK